MQDKNTTVSGLIARLTHRDARIRVAAARELGDLGPGAAAALSALVVAAADTDATVRRSAGEALGRIDPQWATNVQTHRAISDLVRKLGFSSTDVQRAAFHILSQMGQAAVADLMVALRDPNHDGRQLWAARTLGRLGTAAASAVPVLAETLASRHAHVREAAATALADIGPAAEPAVPALVLTLSDWHTDVRRSAARSLARIGRGAEAATASLFQLLVDRDDEVRAAAIAALGGIGPAVCPLLCEFLTIRRYDEVHNWVEQKIAALDWQSFRAHMESYAEDKMAPLGDDFRREPMKAFRNMGWFFRNAVEDHFRLETARLAAVKVLIVMGPQAVGSIDTLTAALTDNDPLVRAAAARALGAIGPAAAVALPSLLLGLSSDYELVRKQTAETLQKIDANWRAYPAVAEHIAKIIPELRRAAEAGQQAADLLVFFGAPAVPALITALADKDRVMREAAANTLGRIGPAAAPAIPALTAALQDEHGWVRDAAARALKNVHPT